jgi:hypothetical protein
MMISEFLQGTVAQHKIGNYSFLNDIALDNIPHIPVIVSTPAVPRNELRNYEE